MKEKSFFILTLGCKINQYESHAIREKWEELGLRETLSPRNADIILINSCAVTENAVADVKKYARRFTRENPRARLIITGCALPRFEREIKGISGVCMCIPQSQKAILLKGWKNEEGKRGEYSGFEFFIHSYCRARPIVKIQDGCSHYCRYCIVPLTRGPSRSRKLEDILKEISGLIKNGFKEIVISGINLKEFVSSYKGKKIGMWEFLRIAEEYLWKENLSSFRFRLSSLDPSMLGEKAIQYLSTSRHIVPHLHLSIQSASPKILRLMGRGHYSPETVKKFIHSLSSIWKRFALGADVLLGFPGEGEEEFKETLAFFRDLPFTYGHVFTYSPRPGTPAAKYKTQVSSQEKKYRSIELRKIFNAKKQRFIISLLNEKKLTLVIEDEKQGVGMCEYYIICRTNGKNFSPYPRGDFLKVEPIRATDKELIVQPLAS